MVPSDGIVFLKLSYNKVNGYRTNKKEVRGIKVFWWGVVCVCIVVEMEVSVCLRCSKSQSRVTSNVLFTGRIDECDVSGSGLGRGPSLLVYHAPSLPNKPFRSRLQSPKDSVFRSTLSAPPRSFTQIHLAYLLTFREFKMGPSSASGGFSWSARLLRVWGPERGWGGRAGQESRRPRSPVGALTCSRVQAMDASVRDEEQQDRRVLSGVEEVPGQCPGIAGGETTDGDCGWSFGAWALGCLVGLQARAGEGHAVAPAASLRAYEWSEREPGPSPGTSGASPATTTPIGKGDRRSTRHHCAPLCRAHTWGTGVDRVSVTHIWADPVLVTWDVNRRRPGALPGTTRPGAVGPKGLQLRGLRGGERTLASRLPRTPVHRHEASRGTVGTPPGPPQRSEGSTHRSRPLCLWTES